MREIRIYFTIITQFTVWTSLTVHVTFPQNTAQHEKFRLQDTDRFMKNYLARSTSERDQNKNFKLKFRSVLLKTLNQNSPLFFPIIKPCYITPQRVDKIH